MLGSKFIKFPVSILKRQANSTSNFASFFIVMTHNSSVNINLYVFHFGLKDPIKVTILRFSRALVKICHISQVIFQTTGQLFVKFCITLQCHERQILCTFLCQTLNTLHNRNQWKYKFLRLQVLGSKFTKFLSFSKQQISFFSNFASVFRVMRHNSPAYTFSAKILYTFNKRSLPLKYKFGEILCEQSKVWNFALWWTPLVQIM